MNEYERQQYLAAEFLRGRLSRGRMLKAALGATVALGAVPEMARAAGSTGTGFQAPYFPQASGTYSTELPAEIVGNLLTLKYANVTAAVTAVRSSAAYKQLATASSLLGVIGAALAAESQYHIDFLESLGTGATPVTTSFTFYSGALSSASGLLGQVEFTERAMIGAELTAVREFAELGQPTLAKNMAQMLGSEAESLAAVRALVAGTGVSSYIPPNNRAFETDLFLYTRDAVAFARAGGLLGGNDIPAAYPGRDAVLAAVAGVVGAIIQKTPNNAGTSVLPPDFAGVVGERP